MTRCEITSPDLARELPACPVCSMKPDIYRRSSNFRFGVCVICTNCLLNKGWDGDRSKVIAVDGNWHSTLYEAVNCWNLLAKLAGSSSDIVSEVRIDRKSPNESTPGPLFVEITNHISETPGYFVWSKTGKDWMIEPPF